MVVPEKATLGLGGLIPSITVSFVTSDCRKSGRLLCRNKDVRILIFNNLFIKEITYLKKSN